LSIISASYMEVK